VPHLVDCDSDPVVALAASSAARPPFATLGMLAPVEFENHTLSEHRTGFAASRLRSSQNHLINNS